MSDVINHATLPTSLISYYKMDEASGDRVDIHGSNDLTQFNGVGQVAGVQGDAADFDGVDQYLSDAASPFTWYANKNSSFSTRVKFDTISGTQSIASQWGSGGVRQDWILYRAGTSLRLGLKGAGNVVSKGGMTTGVWYDITATMTSGNSGELFLNAVSEGSGAGGSQTNTTNAEFLIAQLNSGLYLNGQMDYFAWWDKILTPSEISDLYNSGAGIPYEDAGGGGGIILPQFQAVGFGGF